VTIFGNFFNKKIASQKIFIKKVGIANGCKASHPVEIRIYWLNSSTQVK
jgi:hypothetical protein